jgi:hypothetical protein
MTGTIYSNDCAFARPGQRKLTGTRHEGPQWTNAVRDLRNAVRNAVHLASWRNDTPDSVGIGILDHIDDYHPGSLHVLALVNAMLAKASRR